MADLSKAEHERIVALKDAARGVVSATWRILEHGNSEARKADLRAAILDYQVAKDLLLHAGDISPIENNDILAARQRINDRMQHQGTKG